MGKRYEMWLNTMTEKVVNVFTAENVTVQEAEDILAHTKTILGECVSNIAIPPWGIIINGGDLYYSEVRGADSAPPDPVSAAAVA